MQIQKRNKYPSEPLYIGNRCMSECDYFHMHTERGEEFTCSKYEKKLRAETADGTKEGLVRLKVCQRDWK
jgi:hypothetical protein